MQRLSAIILGCALGALPGLAYACGACLEDKVAATYDHATVTSAASHGKVVVFGQLEGTADPQRATERIRASGGRVRGVQAGTLRASAAPAAFSFALDPRVQTPEAAALELERRVAMDGLHLTVIRVMR